MIATGVDQSWNLHATTFVCRFSGDTFVAEGVDRSGLDPVNGQRCSGFPAYPGGPDWISDCQSQFDVRAKFTGEARIDRVRSMVQRMLADRFQLRLRLEQRPATIFELVLAKGGRRAHTQDEG